MRRMDELLSRLEAIGPVKIIGGFAILVAAVWIFRALFGGKKTDPHHLAVVCDSCAWNGTVSRYKPVCPRCGNKVTLPGGR